MDLSENEFYDGSEAESEYSDDSQEDPSFDLLEETQLSFSNLSCKTKTKTLIIKGKNEEEDECPDAIETVIPELNEDRKSYETIQKIIEGGGVDRLKVEQCKTYLRKHGLRLTGNKETLIHRIKEHIEIVDGGGEKKYPTSSFVLNCKGDACTGDVVIFEQNVYEMFNIASRSANGPPCGTRVVAGRIVKESYGAAKQQHTFTIEVLWSKGEKPLAPLHPLLIKGRNLYRLKTMRQKWEDEGERQKILSEKHTRGDVARSNREARIQKKEMREGHKPTRSTRDVHPKAKQEMAKPSPLLHFSPKKPGKNIQPHYTNAGPKIISTANMFLPQRQPLNGITNRSFVQGQGTSLLPVVDFSYFHGQQSYIGPIGGNRQRHFPNLNQVERSRQMVWHKENKGCGPMMGSLHGRCDDQKQACQYYAQGRCHFGDRCRNSHGSASDTSRE